GRGGGGAGAVGGARPVLMLDEPFNGLDPEGIVWMRAHLRALAAQGRAVLVSSHLMSELQDTAGHVVVVGRGRVIADTGVPELLARIAGDRVTVRSTAASAAGVLTRAGAEVTVTGPDTLLVAGRPAEAVVAALTGAGVPFAEVSAHRATLEDAYLELTRDAVEFRAVEP